MVTSEEESFEFLLPVVFENREFNKETIELDAKNSAIKNDTSPERVVQIDNDDTLYILGRQFNLNAVIGKRKFNFKDTEKQEKKLKYYSALLIQIRNELNLKYNGSVYYFQNENKKISINVPDVKILDYSLEE